METRNHAYRQTVLGNLVFKEDASADSEGGWDRGSGPPPPSPSGKSQVIWVSIENKQLDPPPPGKS